MQRSCDFHNFVEFKSCFPVEGKRNTDTLTDALRLFWVNLAIKSHSHAERHWLCPARGAELVPASHHLFTLSFLCIRFTYSQGQCCPATSINLSFCLSFLIVSFSLTASIRPVYWFHFAVIIKSWVTMAKYFLITFILCFFGKLHTNDELCLCLMIQ